VTGGSFLSPQNRYGKASSAGRRKLCRPILNSFLRRSGKCINLAMDNRVKAYLKDIGRRGGATSKGTIAAKERAAKANAAKAEKKQAKQEGSDKSK
jgi:hypothetical protein